MNNGGGLVNISYEGEFEDISKAFDSLWIRNHFSNLKIISLELPPHGCLSLLHPSILNWEIERDDFRLLEESE
tara:strand:+ start:147 stop:365 length:219 start_codon:yes stop_codon:yes gene_type:complete